MLQVSSNPVGYFRIYEGFWNFSAICGSPGTFFGSSGHPEVSEKYPEVLQNAGFFQIFFIVLLFMIFLCPNFILYVSFEHGQEAGEKN